VVAELDHYDNVVLFEAQDDNESVSIVKHDGRLRVMIESPHESVRVTVPATTVRAAVRAFNRM
jgi:DNA polymerase III sliding clamp (beta) subunit (PCNA family)